MTKEIIQDANSAASDKQPAVESGNISFDDMVLRRLKKPVEAAEQPPVEPEEEPAPEPQEVEPEKPEEEEEAPEPEGMGGEPESEAEQELQDVLSQLNLEDLSQEQIDKIAEAFRSKAVSRYGELTAKRKAAEEEAARLRAEMQRLKSDKNPLEVEKPIENNPFKDLETVEDLQKEYENFTQIEEWADSLLDENEHAAFDDVIAEQDGKEFTKKEIKDYLKKARKAKERFLPARLREIQANEQAKQLKAAFDQKAEAELPWIADTDSSLRKEYEAVLKDPRIEQIRKKVPEVSASLDYLLAHAVNSLSAVMQKQTPKKTAPPAKPPANPSSAATRGIERDSEKTTKQLKELKSRVQQTGKVDDFIALRAAKRRLQNP